MHVLLQLLLSMFLGFAVGIAVIAVIWILGSVLIYVTLYRDKPFNWRILVSDTAYFNWLYKKKDGPESIRIK